MKKLKWTWQKIVTLIGGFLGIGTLVSCYGVPMNVEVYNGTVTGDIDGTEQPIKDIMVDTWYDCVYTDENGYFSVLSPANTELTFTDVDGELNGSFKSTSVTLPSDTHEINVKLTPLSDDSE